MARCLPPLMCLLGLIVATYPMILSGFRLMPADPGDLRLNHYILEHESRALLGRSAFHFWNPGFFHPTPNALAYSDLLLGATPFYAVFRASGLSPDSAFQTWVLLMLALDFAAFFILLGDLGLEALPASFGSYLFAFGSPRIAQINHPQMLPQFYSVAAIIFALRAGRSPSRRRAAVWAGAALSCIVLQLYTAYYLGWFLVLGGMCFGLWAAILPQARLTLRQLWRQHWLAVTVMSMLALLALAPMWWHYTLVVRDVGVRGYNQVRAISPQPQAWLYMGRGSWLYDWMNHFGFWRDMSLAHEKALGIGVFTTVVAFCGLYNARRRCGYRLLLATSLSLGITATLFFNRFSLWKFVYDFVPGAMAVRAVARIGLLLLIPAAIGIALFIAAVQKRRSPFMALAVGLVCVVEQGRAISSFDTHRSTAAVSALAASVDPTRCGYFYSSPRLEPGKTPAWVNPRDVATWSGFYAWKYQLDGMWAGLERDVPTINGHSGNSPRGYAPELMSNIIYGPEDERRLARALDGWIERHGLPRSRFCWIISDTNY